MKCPLSASTPQVAFGENVFGCDRKRAAWRAHLLSAGLIALVALLAYGPLLRPGYIPYSKDSDLIGEHLSRKWAAYRSLHAGQGLPFWKTDQCAGGPALTHPNALYACPLHFLFNLIDPAAAAGPTFWLQFLLMGLGMYLWGCSLGVGRYGRLLMAVAGTLNFKLIVMAYAGWVTAIPAFVMWPILLATLSYCLRSPGLVSTATLAAAAAAFLVSGHPQYIYYGALLAMSYVVAQVFVAIWRRQWRPLGRQALGLTVAGVLALGLVSPLLMSFVADSKLVTRSGADYAFFLSGHQLDLKHLWTLLYPEWLGTALNGSYYRMWFWEDAAYFGLAPLLLAPLGVVMGWRRPPLRWLSAAAAACMLLAFDTPVNRFLFDWLPGYAWFRLPSRFLIFFSLLGIALAGVGVDGLCRWWHATARRRGAGWLMVIAFSGVLLAITIEGTIYARRYLVMRPRAEALPKTDYADFFSHDVGPFRIASVGGWTINYGWVGAMDLQLITGYDTYSLRHYETYFDLMQGLLESPAGPSRLAKENPTHLTDFRFLACPDMLDVLNVKYIVSPCALPLPQPRYGLVATFRNQPTYEQNSGLSKKDCFVYRVLSCMPRAFLAQEVVNATDERDMFEKVAHHNVRPTAVALNVGNGPDASSNSPQDQATVREARAGSLAVNTISADRRYLVVSEVWHPGWRATIDGVPASLYRTDIALMGVWVPPGSHEVRFSFRPPGWTLRLTLAYLCSGLTATLLALGARKATKRRRHPIGDQPPRRVGPCSPLR
jgi:hypothetical protein